MFFHGRSRMGRRVGTYGAHAKKKAGHQRSAGHCDHFETQIKVLAFSVDKSSTILLRTHLLSFLLHNNQPLPAAAPDVAAPDTAGSQLEGEYDVIELRTVARLLDIGNLTTSAV